MTRLHLANMPRHRLPNGTRTAHPCRITCTDRRILFQRPMNNSRRREGTPPNKSQPPPKRALAGRRDPLVGQCRRDSGTFHRAVISCLMHLKPEALSHSGSETSEREDDYKGAWPDCCTVRNSRARCPESGLNRGPFPRFRFWLLYIRKARRHLVNFWRRGNLLPGF
jgi:hypothetical protein